MLVHAGLGHGSLVAIDSTALRSLSKNLSAVDENGRDPVPGFAGRWLEGLAPVEGTNLAVIVQTRYEAAVEPNAKLSQRLLAAGGTALAVGAVFALAMAILSRRRRPL